MKLRDRLRRWWNPAQWADDHPFDAHEPHERTERKGHLGAHLGGAGAFADEAGHGLDRVSVERDFKKPR